MFKTSPNEILQRTVASRDARRHAPINSTRHCGRIGAKFYHWLPVKREAFIPRVRLAKFQMHSVTPLDPPVCITCDAVMIWYRSLRLGPNLVVRYFYCPKCNGIGRLTQRTDHRSPDPPIEYDSDKERL